MKRIGVDVGGTFTDVILIDTETGAIAVHKVPTETDDPSRGVLRGVLELCAREGVAAAEVAYFSHGTTIATNAVLEYRGAATGMITTRGYRDILHIARHQRPQHYSIRQEIPWQTRPLVRRRHRKVVTERLVPPLGEVLVPLAEDEVRQAALELKAAGVEAVAICFLFSYLNDRHEARAKAIVHEVFPEAFVTTSAEVSPQFREYERFTTAAMNAFVGPLIQRYVEHLAGGLAEAGIPAQLHIMRSNGGLATAQNAMRLPVETLVSGPAAGVMAGSWLAKATGRRDLITFDMGGTSADIGVVTAAGVAEASARETQIGGYPVLTPMIDITTIGAGGGSIAHVDAGGAFRVGPRSAGSNPGPACYGKGGTEPTVTDANVVLGRIDPRHFLGGRMALAVERAHAVIGELARALGLTPVEAAEGVITIVNSNMANAIHSRTVQKGLDPRQFSLLAFGGAGPMHAAELARLVGIPEVVVPPYPGITSAMGLLVSDLKYDLVRTEFMAAGSADVSKLARDLAAMEETVQEQLRRDGVPVEEIHLARYLDCRYAGQGYELRVALAGGDVTPQTVQVAVEAFHSLHREEYGHSFPEAPVEIVNARVVGTALPAAVHLEGPRGGDLDAARLGEGTSYFRVGGTLSATKVTYYDRSLLPVGAVFEGPAVVFQMDATTVVPPGARAEVGGLGELILTV